MNTLIKSMKVFPALPELLSYLKDSFIHTMRESIERQGNCTIALSGGTTPQIFYKTLAAETQLPWDKLYFFMVDERFVPFGHADHNFTTIQKAFFDLVPIPPQNLYSIDTSLTSASLAAAAYDRSIQQFFKVHSPQSFPSFDIILLGIGPDGHTASLFPGTSALEEKSLCSISVQTNSVKHERITLTFPVLNNAKNVFFLVTGADKQNILRKICVEQADYPAARVCPAQGSRLFILDKSAAPLEALERL